MMSTCINADPLKNWIKIPPNPLSTLFVVCCFLSCQIILLTLIFLMTTTNALHN